MSLFKKVFKPQEYRDEKMLNAILQMKMSQSKLTKEAKKMEKSAEKSKRKLKQALIDKDIETAKIHAESAVRSASTARSFYRMAGRVDAVCGRMKEAMATQQLTANMGSVVKGLNTALASMTPENVATNLATFEELSDTLDVNTTYMDNTIGGAVANSTPEGDVNGLLEEMAAEVGVENLADLESTAGLPTPIGNEVKVSETPDAVAEGEGI